MSSMPIAGTYDIVDLNFDELDLVDGGHTLREISEAFLVGAGAGAIVGGGNPLAILGGGAIAVGILYL
jgi:hypothetical protein